MISPTMKGFIPDFELALMFTVEAHAGQLDKQGNPYVLHPIRVALMAREMGLDEVTQIALLLHDVVEDTEVTLEQVRFYFGDEVAEIVDAMSRRTVDGVKEQYFVFIDRLTDTKKAIKGKLLDIADNLRPERYVEGLSGLQGRYHAARDVLIRSLDFNADGWQSEEDKTFYHNYHATYSWV